MSLHVEHLRDEVVRPVLEDLGLWSLAAEQLLLGTAAQESRCRYLRQLGRGPARGLWQCEPLTHRDIWRSYLGDGRRTALRRRVLQVAFGSALTDLSVDDALIDELAERLYGDLRYAAAIARIHYWRIPRALPAAGDIAGQAAYWKRYYNTHLGAGTEDQYLASWRLYIAPAGLY